MNYNCKECPVCKVVIENDSLVRFSFGPPGTRERLHARVCQYTKDSNCINKGVVATQIKETDYYIPPKGSHNIDYWMSTAKDLIDESKNKRDT